MCMCDAVADACLMRGWFLVPDDCVVSGDHVCEPYVWRVSALVKFHVVKAKKVSAPRYNGQTCITSFKTYMTV
jgi:hypothetical protein